MTQHVTCDDDIPAQEGALEATMLDWIKLGLFSRAVVVKRNMLEDCKHSASHPPLRCAHTPVSLRRR